MGLWEDERVGNREASKSILRLSRIWTMAAATYSGDHAETIKMSDVSPVCAGLQRTSRKHSGPTPTLQEAREIDLSWATLAWILRADELCGADELLTNSFTRRPDFADRLRLGDRHDHQICRTSRCTTHRTLSHRADWAGCMPSCLLS